ncbi:MAG TPA: 6-bladed beta-propeller [Bacteroidales bacterium]|nr:6-bladed beta-propeller [Bacteroidales bacterium]HPJ60303.1 6-bladed beta-propeller [Bacteroidales bacterium]HPR13465.1 6-bladed beta-propeller [Bacteroidales bacterium]HRW86273.1 6-bladed beta-propeller [Bacteroidales bacterium]
MKLLFLLSVFIILQGIGPKKIIIDVERQDRLKISELADTVIAICLKTDEFVFHNIDKVFLADNNILLFELYQENGFVYSRVMKFDFSGNYLGQIGERDLKSKEFLRIYDMKYDNTTGVIYLVYQDGNRAYEKNGQLLTFYNANGRKPGVRAVQEYIYRNQIWGTTYSHKDGITSNNFICMDLNGKNQVLLKNFISETNMSSSAVFYLANLSTYKNELFISVGLDRTLYMVNQKKLVPTYSIEFKNLPASSINLGLNQLMTGKYFRNNYWIGNDSFDFLYNIETGKSYNIKYHYQNNELTSGLEDDFYNTGFLSINQTNREDYFYFIKQPSVIEGSELSKPEKKNPIIFLVKLR